jgi:hypothetical protein
MAAAGHETEILPEAIDFDGTNDYLSRSSDLVGNTDSKTFTFSCFLYIFSEANSTWVYSTGEVGSITSEFAINFESAISGIRIFGGNNRNVLEVLYSGVTKNVLNYGWNHLLFSYDMSNTSLRSFYLNDSLISTVSYLTYTNNVIPFTNSNHRIGNYTYSDSYEKFKGRFAHVFLDYTYRDLSIEDNRRLFITDDLKPANASILAALNPILYMQMTDPDTAHVNSGTGGDFTLNGTIALSERGPNQDNCVMSDMDSSADYLSKTAFIPDGKVFTCSFTLRPTTNSSEVIKVGNLDIDFSSGILRIISSGVLNLQSTSIVAYAGRNISVQISVDMSNSYVVIVDGEQITMTQTTYVDSNLGLNGVVDIGKYVNGTLGEIYFDNVYLNLLTNNIFLTNSNKPKPVRQVLDKTGNTPLIAMPIEASNAGLNLGTGGDFTVNSGPYVGARGGSEFWARSAKFDGSTGYLNRSSLIGISNSKYISLVLFVSLDALGSFRRLFCISGSGSRYIDLYVNTSNQVQFTASTYDTSWHSVGQNTISTALPSANTYYPIFLSIANESSFSGYFSANGVEDTTFIATDILDTAIALTNMTGSTIAATETPSHYVDGNLGFFYFTTDYIDFSDESNRLLFVDALGYPTDLQKKIDDGEVPEPLIYMPFDDPDDLGKNNGTGGDFTVNGTVTVGSDVDPNA